MSDTSIEIEQLQRRLMMERSPGARLRMATGMFRTARALAAAGARARLGPLTEAALRRELLLRFFGVDEAFQAATDSHAGPNAT
jgi:hypothetical protein